MLRSGQLNIKDLMRAVSLATMLDRKGVYEQLVKELSMSLME